MGCVQEKGRGTPGDTKGEKDWTVSSEDVGTTEDKHVETTLGCTTRKKDNSSGKRAQEGPRDYRD